MMDYCSDCWYFWPFDLFPRLGVCRNKRSQHHLMISITPREACEDYTRRPRDARGVSKSGLEFFWCGTCSKTFHLEELDEHLSHNFFFGASSLEPEDSYELTTAAD